MTFDPFGDFETRGYLRNIANERDLNIVRRLEHTSFITGIDDALRHLLARKNLEYLDVLTTHRTLFEPVYPWAGDDRLQTSPDIAVSRGGTLFAHPRDIRAAIDYALEHGQDTAFMKARPGEVMGYFAYGHPFLDGNGRTIMVVHTVLAQRAGFSIDWAATAKNDYLDALTQEIEMPGKGHLDRYLKSFVKEAIDPQLLAGHVAGAPGLDGNNDANAVLGRFSEPELRARYEQQQLNRQRSQQ